MNQWIVIGLALVIGLGACTGTQSVTHKRWEKHQNRVYLHDITVKNNSLQEAGAQLRLALERQLDDSLFIVGEEPKQAKYDAADRFLEGLLESNRAASLERRCLESDTARECVFLTGFGINFESLPIWFSPYVSGLSCGASQN